MAFTRIGFDEDAYQQQLYESTASGRYNLASYSTYRDDTCFQSTPEIHVAGRKQLRISDMHDQVNIESDLFNLNRKDSKNPRNKYPYVKRDYNKPQMKECTKTSLERSYPLLEAPSFKREQQIQVKRFESLCLNPQQMNRIRSNHFIGLNTRLYNRDNYVPKVPQTKATSALPPASNMSVDTFSSLPTPLFDSKQGQQKRQMQKQMPKRA
jgi:hypothetical protein